MGHYRRERPKPASRPFAIRLKAGRPGVPAGVYLGYRRGAHFWSQRPREALTFATQVGAEQYAARRDFGTIEVVVLPAARPEAAQHAGPLAEGA
jgi:hypothetical protein